MCGCNGGGAGMAVGGNQPYPMRFTNLALRGATAYKYVVTHPDRTEHEFDTDTEAYADIANHPGSGIQTIKVNP